MRYFIYRGSLVVAALLIHMLLKDDHWGTPPPISSGGGLALGTSEEYIRSEAARSNSRGIDQRHSNFHYTTRRSPFIGTPHKPHIDKANHNLPQFTNHMGRSIAIIGGGIIGASTAYVVTK
ncbi:DAO domain-containing protein [Rhizoctonia solani AG-1 IA]|uniref:DAO domain-containing protein n=1 Tax=Thanatephorus cucumeris (strain AG1-IA) TaxID=983506 RepID=L8X3L6_THACA|nr:DAO domain-containing protein [Rhizoctonia solani AG-1 IA]